MFRILLTATLLLSPLANADIRLPKLIGDGMVLQRDTAIPLWGWAAADETVEVRFNGQLLGQVKTKQGRWTVQLPAQQAGGRQVGDGAGREAQRGRRGARSRPGDPPGARQGAAAYCVTGHL